MAGQQRTLDLLNGLIGEKYELIRWIGGGGMAEVYLARHRITGGYFAVKVLAEHLEGDHRIVARFIQEARTAATLSGHPNIVSIFDIGEGDGLHYLIMQYVAGEDLARMLKREGALEAQDAANIAAQVGEALSWAASKGVVHRDLKPSNLYLDRNGRVIVLDFGIAKATDIPSGLTAVGERLGTPYYMCPEQILGQECDQRSDLYSLGVIFFELLTARKPFDADSYRAIEMAHLSTPPYDLQSINPAIPLACKMIVQRLLEKDPANRYQTPADLLSDLQAIGATPNPSHLRPSLDSGIEADLARPTPTTRQSATPSRRTVVENTPTVATPQPDSGTYVAPPTPLNAGGYAPPPTPQATHSNLPIFLGIGFLVLVILAAGGYLVYRKQSTTTAKNPPAVTLPAEITNPTDGTTMELVPAGDFIFGSNNDAQSPNEQATIHLDAFYVDQTEVSNAEYKRFCDATGHRKPPSEDFLTSPDLPVAMVSRDDAEAYAKWAGKRLPSEKEWEKAARGEKGLIYPWGNFPWPRGAEGPPSILEPVHSFLARKSPYGAFNMAGNVAEWTTSHFPVGPREIEDMSKALGTSDFSHSWSAVKGGYFGEDPKADIFFRTYQRRGWPDDQLSPKIGFRCIKPAQ